MTDSRPGWLLGVPLGLLCLLVGSRWLLEGAVPDAGSTLSTQAAGCLLAAGCFGALAGWRRSRSRQPSRVHQGLAAVGLALAFAGPALAVAISGRRISSANSVLAMALVPVVVAVCESIFDGDGNADLIGSLWPGLAGLTGLLLLLPQPALAGWRAWCGLLSMPLMSGAGAVLFSRLSGNQEARVGGRFPAVALGCLFAGGIFAVLMLATRSQSGERLFPGCGLDALTAFLSFFALACLGPTRWSAQFLLIPFLGLVESIAFLRPSLDTRSWIGLACLLVGGLRLLAFHTAEQSETAALKLR